MTEQEFRAKYPPEIIELMLQRQKEQGNPKTIKPFLEEVIREKSNGGFDWENTPEGLYFWNKVLVEENFKLFYDLYSKKYTILELCQKIEELISHLKN